jgi:hypothetical protein
MRLTAWANDGDANLPVNRSPNEIVIAADGQLSFVIDIPSRYNDISAYVNPKSHVVGLGANDWTVTIIGPKVTLSVVESRSEGFGVYVLRLVQRSYRWVHNGDPIPSTPWIPNEMPERIRDGLYLLGVSAQHGGSSASTIATCQIRDLPLEIVDVEFVLPPYGF